MNRMRQALFIVRFWCFKDLDTWFDFTVACSRGLGGGGEQQAKKREETGDEGARAFLTALLHEPDPENLAVGIIRGE